MGPEPEPTKVVPEQGSLVSLTLMYSVHQSKPLAGCSPIQVTCIYCTMCGTKGYGV